MALDGDHIDVQTLGEDCIKSVSNFIKQVITDILTILFAD